MRASKYHTRLWPRIVGGTGSYTTPSSSSAAFTSQMKTADVTELGWSKWLLFFPGAITFGLGTWQIFRRQEKIDVLEHVKKQLSHDPLLLNKDSSIHEDLEPLEFRKVAIKGVFDEDKSIFVGPRSRSISGVTENGYYIITPLMPVPGNSESVRSPVLVNRGWVPRSWKDKPKPKPKPSHDSKSEQKSQWKFWLKNSEITEDKGGDDKYVEMVGLIRGCERPSIFVPENDPISGQWFYIDVPAMAEAMGLPKESIYVERIDETTDASNTYPVTKELSSYVKRSVMPQDHLNYTLTWYSLSGAVTFMAYKRIQQSRLKRR